VYRDNSGKGSAGHTPARAALEPSAIGASILFRGLEPKALLDAANVGKIRRFSKGSTVFEQEAPADQVFVLLQGRIKAIQSTSDGQQVTARFLKPGDPFGCVALMAAGTYPVSTLAEVDSLVAVWNASWMMDFANRYPKIAMNALAYVGSQLRDTQIRFQEAITEHIEQRIAHALLRLLSQSGRKTAEGIEINFPISRQDIAEITGSRLFTVSRTLSKWQLNGIIKSGRRRVTVIAPHRLLMIAEKSSSEPK
jgi:CRP-like cAMP-binding protein